MKEKAILGVVMTIVLATTIGVTPILLVLPHQSASALAPRVMSVGYSDPRASIATSNNNVYVTWWDNKTGNNEVFFARSTDNGKSFNKTINISNATGCSADNQIAVQGNNVYITWWDNKTGNWQVFSRASTDAGKTFGDSVMLQSIGSSPVKKLTPPPAGRITVDTLLATSGNNTYVSWWDNRTGNWEVLFTKSSDNGKSFSDTINISKSPDARSLGARMAAQGNNVYITWWDTDKTTGVKNVFFRASNDNGNTFGSPIMLNSTATAAAVTK